MIRFTKAAALAAFVLAGCTNVEFRRETSQQTLAYTDAAGKSHIITGFIAYGGWNEKMLTISMNGTPAIKGNLDWSNGSGTIPGQFGPVPAVANCSGQGRGMPTLSGQYQSYAIACQIFADGKPIGTLNF